MHDVLAGMLLASAQNLIPGGGYENTHQGADEIEKTERKVGECRYAQDCRLGHAAAAPWKQRRRDGG